MKETDFIRQILPDTAVFVRARYGERTNLRITSKAHANDLLTEVDLAVQDRIVAAIHDTFPGDAIAAEERDFSVIPDDPSCRCWVIDPIDGTQNFIRGLFPTFGISLAFAQGGHPVAGGVAMPMINDLFWAEVGGGAWRNGDRLHVSDVNQLSMARVEIDFSGPPERVETLARTSRIITTAGQIRCHCAAVVGLCSIASGDADAYVHVTLHPWDYAASQLIIEEAGGKATRLDGTPVHLFDKRKGFLASNGLLHTELQQTLVEV